MAEKNASKQGTKSSRHIERAPDLHPDAPLIDRKDPPSSTKGQKLRLVYSGEPPERTKWMRPTSNDPELRGGPIDRSLQAQLGRQLRNIFQGVADEPVPERFIELLEKLAAKEADHQAPGASDRENGASSKAASDEETER
jgi:hypothetical protein